jgi:hypothetical protein
MVSSTTPQEVEADVLGHEHTNHESRLDTSNSILLQRTLHSIYNPHHRLPPKSRPSQQITSQQQHEQCVLYSRVGSCFKFIDLPIAAKFRSAQVPHLPRNPKQIPHHH